MRIDHSASQGIDVVLDRAAQLISANGDDLGTAHGNLLLDVETEQSTGGGMCQSLIEVGWFASKQFEVMLGYTETHSEGLQLIPRVIDRAVSYGSATPDAVGAAALLVDLVRSDDVLHVIDTITAARSALGDRDLACGVAAFIASLTEQIAQMAAIDPVVVHGELCRGLPRAQPARASDSFRRVGADRRTTCSRWVMVSGAAHVA